MTDEPSAELDDASSVLVLAPDVADADVKACASLLEHGRRTVDRIAAVTVAQGPTEWQRAWEQQWGSVPAETTIVDVPGLARSAAAAESTAPAGASVETVTDTSDLTALGGAVEDIVAEAQAAGEHVGVCVHSLSALAQHDDEQRVFNFVTTVSERLRAADGAVYFTLDRDCHDRETVELFASACDVVVELDGDGVTVSQS